MSDEPPKSAIELAMERLRKKDQEAGIQERAVTDEEKAAIADARRVAEARFAELEILHRSKLALIPDPDARAVLEEEYRRDRERAAYDRDRKIEEIRSRGK